MQATQNFWDILKPLFLFGPYETFTFELKSYHGEQYCQLFYYHLMYDEVTARKMSNMQNFDLQPPSVTFSFKL